MSVACAVPSPPIIRLVELPKFVNGSFFIMVASSVARNINSFKVGALVDDEVGCDDGCIDDDEVGCDDGCRDDDEVGCDDGCRDDDDDKAKNVTSLSLSSSSLSWRAASDNAGSNVTDVLSMVLSSLSFVGLLEDLSLSSVVGLVLGTEDIISSSSC